MGEVVLSLSRVMSGDSSGALSSNVISTTPLVHTTIWSQQGRQGRQGREGEGSGVRGGG